MKLKIAAKPDPAARECYQQLISSPSEGTYNWSIIDKIN